MNSNIHVLGHELFKSKENGQLQSSIGTVFPRHGVIVTDPPLHALQRDVFKTWLASKSTGRIPNQLKLDWEATESVDVFFMPGGYVVIRPELERLDLALSADEMLQELCHIPLYKIMFLSVQDKRVRQALRERGELWRISSAVTRGNQSAILFNSKVAIANEALYYYNPHTGTRYLTCAEFDNLSLLNEETLRAQLAEIGQYSSRRNRHGYPEVAFFGADNLKFGSPNLFGVDFQQPLSNDLRFLHSKLLLQFKDATEPYLQGYNQQDKQWQTQLHSALAFNQDVPLEKLKDYGDILWLPGGSFINGEFHFAPIDDKDTAATELRDSLARGFITNFIREHANVEYINIGKISEDDTKYYSGRQGVYLAEIKIRGELNHRVLLLRLLRWGIRERLDERDGNGHQKSLVDAVFETEEYIDYSLDRRLGCLQLGMRLPHQVHMRRLTEEYTGSRREFKGRFFPVIYFERDFILGVPTHRIPERKLAETRYALGVARLLGKAAASNLIVGRSLEQQNGKPIACIFDMGNELIIEGSDGLPMELIVVGHSGAFVAWRQPDLLTFSDAYAAPVNHRVHLVPDPKAFAETYIDALQHEMQHIQLEYEKQRNAFDGLFKHLPRNEHGNFAHRWDCVLKRLREADIALIIKSIRKHITVLEAD